MRWARFEHGDQVRYGVVEGDVIACVDGAPFTDPRRTGEKVALEAVRLLAPVIPPTFYAAGINYLQHVLNAQAAGLPVQVPKQADIGYRAVNALIGTDSPIVVPADSSGKLQFEGELVAVIGRVARRVKQEDALSYVFGYTIGNDVSERSWQKSDRTFWRAKNTDTFKPMGPWIETDVDLDALVTTVHLNGDGGEPLQDQRHDIRHRRIHQRDHAQHHALPGGRDLDGNRRSHAGHGRGRHGRGHDQRHRHAEKHGRRRSKLSRRNGHACGGRRVVQGAASGLPPRSMLIASAHDRFDLEHEVFLHQAIDDEQRVGRIKRPFENCRKQRCTRRHERRDVLRMDQVGRELDDVVESHAHALEDGAEVVEDLRELALEVPGADDAAVRTDGQLAGDEEERPRATLPTWEYSPCAGQPPSGLMYSTVPSAFLLICVTFRVGDCNDASSPRARHLHQRSPGPGLHGRAALRV